MYTANDLNVMADALQTKLEEKYRLRARDLPQAVAKAGRRLPRRHRRAARELISARALGGHPKLMRRVNLAALQRAHSEIMRYLDTIDPADVRRGAILSMLGDIVLKLLIVFAVFITWLWWRGIV